MSQPRFSQQALDSIMIGEGDVLLRPENADLIAPLFQPWPDSTALIQHPTHYASPSGQVYARVTRVCKVVGTSTDPLVRWSANEERKAVIEAAAETWIEGTAQTPAGFVYQIEQRIGTARKHQTLLAKAADIGTIAHQAVRDWLQGLIEGRNDHLPSGLPEPSLVAAMAFQDWFRESGLTPLRMEQLVWDDEYGYAGTVDLIASGPGGIGIVDLKTSKGIWDTFHLQVAAYCHAARKHADIRWAKLVRVPKSLDDPTFEVKELGKLFDRTLTEDQCFQAFLAAGCLWRTLVAKS